MNRFILCMAILFAAGIGCDSKNQSRAVDQDAKEPLTKVSLQLNWYPEAEHGGYYAALVHGYYRDAGLDVTILPGGPETPVITQVANEKATFGIVNADGILFGRAEQAPVVALMAPLQTSPRCLIVHEASGIRDFSQLKNMTLAMSNTQAFSHYLQHKVPLEGVRIVPYLGNVAPFLSDPNYGQQGYVFSEPYIARKEGGDPHVLMLAELGFNPYTSLLFTSEQEIERHRDMVVRMTRASIQGWQKYLEAPAETNAYIHKLNPEMDLEILAFGAEAIRPLAENQATQQSGFGVMTLERWRTLFDQLVECKQLKDDSVKANSVFSNDFIPVPASNTQKR